MTSKPAAPPDYRMSAAEFNKMMRGVSFAPQADRKKAPPKKARQAKQPKKKRSA